MFAFEVSENSLVTALFAGCNIPEATPGSDWSRSEALTWPEPSIAGQVDRKENTQTLLFIYLLRRPSPFFGWRLLLVQICPGGRR